MKKIFNGLIIVLLLAVNMYAAMDFEVDNSGERVDCGNVDLSSYDTASFSLWAQRESVSTDARLLCSAYGGGYSQNWCIIMDDDAEPYNLQARIRTDDEQQLQQGDNLIYDDVLYFICMTYDGTNMRLYLDGEVVDTDGLTGNITNLGTPATTIGTDTSQTTDRCFDGIIEDVRIYNRALSNDEIRTMYRARGIDNIYHGLLHRWLLAEQTSGTEASGADTVKDMVGNNSGTPSLTPTYAESQLKYRRTLK